MTPDPTREQHPGGSDARMGKGIVGPNHADLTGELAAYLSRHFDVELVVDEHGNYTDRLLIKRPSGTWGVRVEPVAVYEGNE